MKKVVLLDIDDTLADFNGELWRIHNKMYNSNVRTEDVLDWDLSLFSPVGKAVYELFKLPNFYRSLPLKPYAKELVTNLLNYFEVYMVTDAPMGVTNTLMDTLNKPMSNPVDDKRLWVSEHFPDFPLSNIIFTSKKELIIGDIIVDDKPETIEKFMRANRAHILVDMPYNAKVNTPYRAFELKQVEKMIFEALN